MPLQAFPAKWGSGRTACPQWSNVGYSGVTVTAGGTIGTYGSWAQIVASTSFDAHWIQLRQTASFGNSTARSDVTLQIGFGANPNEYAVVDALVMGGKVSNSNVTIPLYVPAGTRISVRAAAGVASRALTTSIAIIYGQQPGVDVASVPRAWKGYGLTVVSGTGAYGTIVAPGASNSWGSWTALTTSTTYAHELWLPMAGIGSATAVTAVNVRSQFAFETTTNAATAVTNGTVLDGPWWTYQNTETFCHHGAAGSPYVQGFQDLYYAPRAAGSPISARAMSSGVADSNACSLAMLGAIF